MSTCCEQCGPATLVDTATAAHAAGVAEATIRDWYRRNWLTRHGTKKRSQWDLAEVYRVAASLERERRRTQDWT